MKSFVSIAFVGLAFVACSSPSSPGVDVPVIRLRSEPYSFAFTSGLHESVRLVVRDSETWRSIWNQLYDRRSTVPALPDIDFSKEMIVVAALGERGSGGYSVVFGSASENGAGGIDVVVRSISPGRYCALPALLTQPVDLARISNKYASIRFIERNEVVQCGN